MKKLILIAAVSCLAISGFSQTKDKSLAKVEQQASKNGSLFVFIHALPVNEYEVLGKVNMPEVVWGGKAGEMIKIATNRTLKQYPKAEGVILNSNNLGSNVMAIKFK